MVFKHRLTPHDKAMLRDDKSKRAGSPCRVTRSLRLVDQRTT